MLIHVDDKNFDAEVIKSEIPVMVDFSAEWCGPCRMLAPIIEELAKEYAGRVKICACDTDQANKAAMSYRITAVPSVITFKGGKEIGRVTGYKPKAELRQRLDALLLK